MVDATPGWLMKIIKIPGSGSVTGFSLYAWSSVRPIRIGVVKVLEVC